MTKTINCSLCDQPARWQDSINGMPVKGGRRFCQQHAICTSDPKRLVPFYNEDEMDITPQKPSIPEQVMHCQCCASPLADLIRIEHTERVICTQCLGFIARWWLELGQDPPKTEVTPEREP